MNGTVKQSGNMDLPWWIMVIDTTEENPHPAFYSGHATEEEACILASDMQEMAGIDEKIVEEKNKIEVEERTARGLPPRLEREHKHQYSVVAKDAIVDACLEAMPREQLLEIYISHNPQPVKKPSILNRFPIGSPVTLEVVNKVEEEDRAYEATVEAWKKAIDAMSDDALRKELKNTPSSKMHPGYCIQRPKT